MSTTGKRASKIVQTVSPATKKIYVGIDPGKSGAISVLFPDRRVKAWHTPVIRHRFKYPKKRTRSGKPAVSVKVRYCPKMMLLLLSQAKKAALKANYEIIVCLERQWARPTDSKSVVESFAKGYATWTTLIELLELPLTEVSPSVWKPRYVSKGAEKVESIRACRKLYPGLKLPRMKDECVAEATLIADYVYRRDHGLSYPRTPPPRKRSRRAADKDEQPPKREKTSLRRKSAMLSSRRALR